MTLATRFGRTAVPFRSDSPLSDDQIARFAPSIFATEAHQGRSQRYTYIPTSAVLANLAREGFLPFMVAQANPRDEGRRGHTKHMVRLRHAADIAADEAAEFILLNSHDGTSSFQLLAGMLRFVCMNGMVIGDRVQEIRVRHSGNVVAEVIEGAYALRAQFGEIEAAREEMKAIEMNPDERRLFAESALMERYDENTTAPISAAQVLGTRRQADAGTDLWTTFNVAQENLTKGGLRGTTRSGGRARTRAVTGIDGNVKVNRGLWNLAEGMAALKNGKTLEEFLATTR